MLSLNSIGKFSRKKTVELAGFERCLSESGITATVEPNVNSRRASDLTPLFQHILCGMVLLIGIFSGGCSSSTDSISAGYRLETRVWGLGDTGWKISLWGLDERGRWREVWPSLGGEGQKLWLVSGDSVLFIGWAKKPTGVGDKRLLVTTKGASAIDLTDVVVASGKAKGLIPVRAQVGKDFALNGLVQNGDLFFAEVRGLTQEADFTFVLLPIDGVMVGSPKGK